MSPVSLYLFHQEIGHLRYAVQRHQHVSEPEIHCDHATGVDRFGPLSDGLVRPAG